jgi:hypothetical protein
MSGGRQMLAKNQSGKRLTKRQLQARDKPPTSSKAPRSGPSRQPLSRPKRAIAAGAIYAGADSDSNSDGDSDSDLSCSGGPDDGSDCAGSDVDDE